MVHTRTIQQALWGPQWGVLNEMSWFIDQKEFAQYNKLHGKTIPDSLHIHEATMREYDITDEIYDMQVGLEHRLFEFDDPTYLPPTMEFLCTFTADARNILDMMPSYIPFCLGGMIIQVTINEFSRAIRPYDYEDKQDLSYA